MGDQLQGLFALEQAGLENEVLLRVVEEGIVIEAADQPRAGWGEGPIARARAEGYRRDRPAIPTPTEVVLVAAELGGADADAGGIAETAAEFFSEPPINNLPNRAESANQFSDNVFPMLHAAAASKDTARRTRA